MDLGWGELCSSALDGSLALLLVCSLLTQLSASLQGLILLLCP